MKISILALLFCSEPVNSFLFVTASGCAPRSSFNTSRSGGTPAWCKGVIYGAPGYFISLIDGIPDLIPVPGYSDDLAVMAATVATLTGSIHHTGNQTKSKTQDRHEFRRGGASIINANA